jgi:exodeoxyribonuclease VII large subunit
LDLFEYAKKHSGEESERPDEAIHTVSEITAGVKSAIAGLFGRENVWVKGELSNFRGRNQSGHMYFRLKDAGAVLNCVFFRNANRKLELELKDGTEILAFGRIDVWEQGGNYQLIVEDLRVGGTGELYLRFEMLKKKLEGEGLFDPARKRALPEFPKRIGLVTSPTGAAIRDIITVTRQRCPFVHLLLHPVKVQGEGAASEISAAIAELNDPKYGLELLIAARGGGSIEDLWAFNEEAVARAIAASRIPVISAVGHQTDFTIADFVADVRAATPSHAAEMSVPNVGEVRDRVERLTQAIVRELLHVRDVAAQKLEALLRAPVLRDPASMIRARLQQLDLMVERMAERVVNAVRPRRVAFEKAAGSLSLLNPLAVLERGYSVVTKRDGGIVKKGSQVKKGEEVNVRLHEGELGCQITKISG